MHLILKVLLLLSSEGCFLAALSASCPAVCTCRWKSGKETAECAGRRLEKIPAGLSQETQVLDISNNNLKYLDKEIFWHSGLQNLQKLNIAKCKIRKIDDHAFSNLTNLVELDLADNLLVVVPSETFVDYPELRRLTLSENPIRRLESNAFARLKFLSLLEISKCYLDYVGPKAFNGLNHLQHLKLDGNKITTLPVDVGFPLKSLLSLELFDNPWRCDCHLRVLRNWLVNNELPVNAVPTCTTPTRLEGKYLSQIEPEEYACPPETPSYSVIIETFVGDSAKLLCSVKSDPPADIWWSRNGRTILNLTRITGRSRTYLIQEKGTTDKKSTLIISSSAFEDSGEYLCTAQNLADLIVINVTLVVLERSAEVSNLTNGHIAGISIGLILVSVVTIVFICVLLAKMRNQHSEESKHLELDKSKNLHLVNHVKFDVTKERLEMTTENSVHKPLCSVVNSNYNSGSPNEDNMRLEDAIGGCVRSSSRILSNKPDVVNFTCNLRSPDSEGMNVSNCSSGDSKNLNDTLSPVKEKDNSSYSLNDTNGREVYKYDNVSCFSSKRTESKEKLCDYLQFYEDVSDSRLPPTNQFHGKDDSQEMSDSLHMESRHHQIDFEGEKNWPRSIDSLITCGQWSECPSSGSDDAQMTLGGYKMREDLQVGGDWSRNNESSTHRNDRFFNKICRVSVPNKRYGTLGNAPGILKHVNLHGRNYVPVLPPLPVRHFAEPRDSPDEGYEDEVEEEMDM